MWNMYASLTLTGVFSGRLSLACLMASSRALMTMSEKMSSLLLYML